MKCNRNILGADGEALIPVGECFVQFQIGEKIYRDRVIVIQNLKCNYILGQVLHRAFRFRTGYSTTGRHYITMNGKMVTEAISQVTDNTILKTTGKISLPPVSLSVVGINIRSDLPSYIYLLVSYMRCH